MTNRLVRVLYPIVLAVTAILATVFLAFFFLGYFNPNFIGEFRETAAVGTVLGFAQGINPFGQEYLEDYGNVYSVIWPGLIFLIARVFGAESFDQIRLLMYVVNAVIVLGMAAIVFAVARRNGLGALLALTLAFTFFLLNSTRFSMGEFSYAAGLACCMGALLLVRNRFDALSATMALVLVTLASLFKIYFALFGVVVVIAAAGFLPLATLAAIVAGWLVATAGVFAGLTYFFPFYFDAIYLLQRMFPMSSGRWAVSNIVWFLPRFGFMFVLVIPQLLQYRRLSPEAKRRDQFYAAGSFVMSLYVLMVVLPHMGNHGLYLMHLSAPLILAYAVSKCGDAAAPVVRWTGLIGALAMGLTVFVDPTFRASPVKHWREYGVLSDELTANGEVLKEADRVIALNAGKTIFVEPILAPLALKRHLDYLDMGSREYLSPYLNARRTGTLQPSPLTGWLAGRVAPGPERLDPDQASERAAVVICAFRCRGKTPDQFVRELGVLTTAWGESYVVRLYDDAVVKQ